MKNISRPAKYSYLLALGTLGRILFVVVFDAVDVVLDVQGEGQAI